MTLNMNPANCKYDIVFENLVYIRNVTCSADLVYEKLRALNVQGVEHVLIKQGNKYGLFHFSTSYYASLFYHTYYNKQLFDNITIGRSFNSSEPVVYGQVNPSPPTQDTTAKELLKGAIDKITLRIVSHKKQAALLIQKRKALKKVYDDI